MVKHLRLNFSPQAWVRPLSLYWNRRIWGDVWRQSRRFRWPSGAMEVAFLWLLGLLGGSFVLLQASHYQYFWVPPGALWGGKGLAALLTIAPPDVGQPGLGRGIVLALGLATWLCLVAGTEKLRLMVALAYQGAPSRRSTWAKRLRPWVMAIVLVITASLVVQLMAVSGQAEGVAQTNFPGGNALMPLGRWLVAVTLTTLGLALINWLSPVPWLRGSPLWPGVWLTLGLGMAAIGLGQWGLGWLQTSAIAYALFLDLGLRLALLYWLILLVPLGAQFNISCMAHRGGSGGSLRGSRLTPPPPSFDSFKIKRRSD